MIGRIKLSGSGSSGIEITNATIANYTVDTNYSVDKGDFVTAVSGTRIKKATSSSTILGIAKKKGTGGVVIPVYILS